MPLQASLSVATADLPIASLTTSPLLTLTPELAPSLVPSLVLAQGAPPLAGTPTAPAPGATAAPGATPVGGGGAAAPQNGSAMLIFMFGAIALLMVFTYMGNRRETKRKKELLESLKKNDRVQTIGGIIGVIVETKPDTIVLRVDENSNTRVTFARTAVVGVVKEAAAAVEQPKS